MKERKANIEKKSFSHVEWKAWQNHNGGPSVENQLRNFVWIKAKD